MIRARLVPVAVLVALTAAGCTDDATHTPRPPFLSLVETLGGADTAGYARAVEPRAFSFPNDHGPHPAFRTEWWYATGNLSSDTGRRFGFQLTIFRSALAPTEPGGPSAWATNQAYMGHFALTDVEGGRFWAFERFARGDGRLAGARARPLAVWVEGWRIDGAVAPTGGVFPLRLAAEAEGVALELNLEAGKPMVLHGDRGLSRKGPEPGNASYYYAYTRMPTSGRLTLDGATVAVEGLSWLDREWSTSALSAGQVGWDWFALQLDDGWDLMVYRLRRADGSADPFSEGALVDPEGHRTALRWGVDIEVAETDRWTAPSDGAVYPSGWRVRIPGRGWDLTVRPAVADQELRLAFRYWEGAVEVDGVGEGGAPVRGRGYVELTGYADDLAR